MPQTLTQTRHSRSDTIRPLPSALLQPISSAPPAVRAGTRAGGSALDLRAQREMSARFGHDFSKVRIHTDARAGESAQAVGANAFALGGDIVFGAGKYNPGSPDTERLLAHELTHVVQQAQFGMGDWGRTSRRSDASEREADSLAARVMRGQTVQALAAPGAALARDPGDDPAPGVCSAEPNASYSPPAPNMTPATPDAQTPAPAGQDSTPTGGSVTMCDRDFAFPGSKYVMPARHCFAWMHPAGTNMTPATIDPSQTSTYDNKTSGTPDPATSGKDTECHTTYDIDPTCVEQKYKELCQPSDYSLDQNNCCSCENQVMLACGAQPQPSDFPAKNQGVGLPDSDGTGWKKSALSGLRDTKDLMTHPVDWTADKMVQGGLQNNPGQFGPDPLDSLTNGQQGY